MPFGIQVGRGVERAAENRFVPHGGTFD